MMIENYEKLPRQKSTRFFQLGQRVFAFTIDWAVIQTIKTLFFISYSYAIVDALSFLSPLQKETLIFGLTKIDPSILFIVFISYFILCQFRFDGQTLGMKLMKIKTVSYYRNHEGAHRQPSIRQYFWKTMCYVSIATMVFIPYRVYASHSGINSLTLSPNIAFIAFLISSFIFAMPLLREDGKTIGDIISSTEVTNIKNKPMAKIISLRPEINYDWNIDDEVIENNKAA